MTEHEKELLLKDLCARLPYGVKVSYRISENDNLVGETLSGHMLDYFNENSIVEVKPYLRPMSSMTEEEKNECKTYLRSVEGALIGDEGRHIWFFDYCYKHHFDIRGLIPKGLAIEVTEENNPYK